MKKTKQTMETWKIDRPIPYARNPRKISDQAVASVAGSIKEFGFKSPIIVDAEGVIIAGHTRLKAAMLLGMKEVPVIVAKDLTPAQCQAYRLADNRVSEFTDWDAEMLKLELGDCNVDLAFADFEALLAELPEPEAETMDEDSPALAVKYLVIAECLNEDQQATAFETLTAKGIKCKLSTM